MSTPHWGTGSGGLVARNTEQDTPTQREGPLEPRTLAPQVQGALYGGAIPDFSEHWLTFFQDKHANPYGVLGDKPGITQKPNVASVAAQVAEPQNLVSGGSSDVWRGFFDTIMGSMRNDHNTNYPSSVR